MNISYYTSHANGKRKPDMAFFQKCIDISLILVVSLAQWQMDGIAASKAAGKPVLMGEFNTASCGGFPGTSDTFAATLWVVDYVLQLASVGYDGAYIHTRERGITYNLFDPPASNDSSTNWTTLPTYYSLLTVSEALSPGWQNGSFVVDFGLNNNSETSTIAGYGIYDGQTNALSSMVFLNYADVGQGGASFSLPSLGRSTISTRILAASSLTEKFNISWAGMTYRGVGNGVAVSSGFAEDQEITCGDTCNFVVPSPGSVVVWLGDLDSDKSPVPADSNSSGARSRFSLHYVWSGFFSILSFIFGLHLSVSLFPS